MGFAPRMDESRRRAHTARLLLRARSHTGQVRERYENEVVRLNLVVALEVARRYRGRGIADDDLDQVASLGLVKAVRAFDVTRGVDFLGFAVPTVRGEIQRHFRDAGWAVRPPRSVQEARRHVAGAEAELTQSLGRRPRPSEIAAHLDLPEALVRDSISARGFAAEPLEAAMGGLGRLDPAYESAEARVALDPLLRTLDERERTILALRFREHRTQSEIGEAIGLSQEQVSRLLAGILRRLRHALDGLDEGEAASTGTGTTQAG